MSLADEIALASGDDSQTKTKTKKERSLADQIEAAHVSVSNNNKQATESESYNPTGSDFENYAAGVGKSVYDVGRGSGQILRTGLSYLPNGEAMSDKMGLTTTADVDEAKKRDAALMKTKAGVVGDISGNVATTLLPFGAAAKGLNYAAKGLNLAAKVGVPLASTGASVATTGVKLSSMLANPTTYTAGAASGALNGALQPTGTGDNRLHNTAYGAAAGLVGNGLANTIGRVAVPVKNALSTTSQKSLQILRDAGLPIDLAQATGSSLLNTAKSSFTDNPFTKGAQLAANAVQGSAFTRAALRFIGADAPAGTREVMGATHDRIDNVFQDILNRNDIALKDTHISKIADVQKAALDESQSSVSNFANRLVGLVREDGTAPGQQVYNIKKDLDRLSSSPDTTLAYHARQLRSTVMDTIHESLSPTDQMAFAEVRGQFRDMKRIEPALDKSGTGEISPSMLANVFSQKANRAASIYGKGDQGLLELAQAGKQFLGDKTPNSGTTGRLTALGLPLLAGGAAGGASGYNGDYEGAISKAALGAGAMIVAPKIGQYIINGSGANRYMTQGIKNTMLRDMLQSPQNQELVGGAIRRLPGASISAQ